MLAGWIRPLRFLAQGVAAADTPRQLALGFTLGMVVGLVPKGNLTAVLLSMIILGTRVNLATGVAGAALFSWLTTWTDPLAHRIGFALLTHEPWQPLYAWLFALPLLPWTGLNNTVVFGSLMLGIWLFWPVQHLSLGVFERLRPWASAVFHRYRITDLLFGTEFAARWRN